MGGKLGLRGVAEPGSSFQDPQDPGSRVAGGVVHPWVGQKLLKCNEIKSLFVRPR